MLFRQIIVLSFVLLVFLSSPVSAEVLDKVQHDFRPLSGYVIMPANGEYLIDLDTAKGVVAGDLFSLVAPGEKIIHPVTKEVLGTVDEKKGVLRVTRVRSGYSYARPLGPATGIVRGDVVRRYQDMQAAFWDYTGRGESVFVELKDRLSGLEWRDYAAAQAEKPSVPAAPAAGTALVFVLRNDGLEVRDAEFRIIHAYPVPESLGAAVSPAPAAVTAPGPTAVLATGSASASVAWEKGGGVRPEGRGYDLAFPGFNNVGALSGRTVMADFVRDGDRLLLAATEGTAIEVFAVGSSLTPVAKGDTTMGGRIVSLHWWRPAAEGPLYLAVTSEVEESEAFTVGISHTVSGSVFTFQQGRLIPVREGFSYLLGTFDRDGDGTPETLLGQSFDRDIFFGEIRELRLSGTEIESIRLSFPLPPRFPVQGSLLADLTGDGRPEAIYVRNRVLYIYQGDELLYESSPQMGGSLAAMTYNINPGAVDPLFTTESFEVSPVASDLDGDGRLELVAIASEGSSFRAPGIGPGINKSWLAVVKFRDGMFVKGSLGEDLDNPIQGLAVDGNRMLFVLSRTRSILNKEGSSYLLALPLSH